MMIKYFLLLFLVKLSFGQEGFKERFKTYMSNQYSTSEKIIDYDNLNQIKIPFTIIDDFGLNYIPCLVNGVYDYFVFDTGCSSGLVINNSMFKRIIKTKNVLYEDYLGDSSMMTATGNYSIVKVLIMKEVIIGNPSKSIRLKNVLISVYESDEGPLLVGQDILKRFSTITINNQNQYYEFKK